MKDTIINLLESSWKLREELWNSELPFPELLKRTVTMKDDFFDKINLDNFLALLNSNTEIKNTLMTLTKKGTLRLLGNSLKKAVGKDIYAKRSHLKLQ